MEEDGKIWGYSKKALIIGLLLVVVAGGMFYIGAKYEKNKLSNLGLLKNGTEQVVKEKKVKKSDAEMQKTDVKEFSMTSYYDDAGKWVSLKEMSVK